MFDTHSVENSWQRVLLLREVLTAVLPRARCASRSRVGGVRSGVRTSLRVTRQSGFGIIASRPTASHGL